MVESALPDKKFPAGLGGELEVNHSTRIRALFHLSLALCVQNCTAIRAFWVAEFSGAGFLTLRGIKRSQSFQIDEDFNQAEAERLPRKSCSYACAMVKISRREHDPILGRKEKCCRCLLLECSSMPRSCVLPRLSSALPNFSASVLAQGGVKTPSRRLAAGQTRSGYGRRIPCVQGRKHRRRRSTACSSGERTGFAPADLISACVRSASRWRVR